MGELKVIKDGVMVKYDNTMTSEFDNIKKAIKEFGDKFGTKETSKVIIVQLDASHDNIVFTEQTE